MINETVKIELFNLNRKVDFFHRVDNKLSQTSQLN